MEFNYLMFLYLFLNMINFFEGGGVWFLKLNVGLKFLLGRLVEFNYFWNIMVNMMVI